MRSMPAPSRSSLVFRWFLFVAFVAVVALHVVGGWMRSGDIVDEWFSPPSDIPMALDAAGLDIQEVTYPSPLGDMTAWLVDGNRSEWVVHVHGQHSGPADTLPVVEALAADGYNQLVVSYRNDPGQPADPSGLRRHGITEWADLEAAMAWAEAEGATEVAIVADGTGASIVLEYQARTRSPLVRSMVFDAPVVSLGATIDARAAEESIFGIPIPFTVTETAKFLTGLRISVNWERLDHMDRLDAVGVPILVLHGTADPVVPFGPSEDFAGMSSVVVQLDAVEGATDRPLATGDPADWAPRVTSFIGDGWR